jgi:hypothetical protein
VKSLRLGMVVIWRCPSLGYGKLALAPIRSETTQVEKGKIRGVLVTGLSASGGRSGEGRTPPPAPSSNERPSGDRVRKDQLIALIDDGRFKGIEQAKAASNPRKDLEAGRIDLSTAHSGGQGGSDTLRRTPPGSRVGGTRSHCQRRCRQGAKSG